MKAIQTRVTAQGQVSVPAEIRRKLGIGPGSVLEWKPAGDTVTIRRAGRYTFKDIHQALFQGRPPKRRTLKEIDEGIRRYIRKRYARH